MQPLSRDGGERAAAVGGAETGFAICYYYLPLAGAYAIALASRPSHPTVGEVRVRAGIKTSAGVDLSEH